MYALISALLGYFAIFVIALRNPDYSLNYKSQESGPSWSMQYIQQLKQAVLPKISQR